MTQAFRTWGRLTTCLFKPPLHRRCLCERCCARHSQKSKGRNRENSWLRAGNWRVPQLESEIQVVPVHMTGPSTVGEAACNSGAVTLIARIARHPQSHVVENPSPYEGTKLIVGWESQAFARCQTKLKNKIHNYSQSLRYVRLPETAPRLRNHRATAPEDPCCQ